MTDERALRDVFGAYPTGVVIITAEHDGRPHGIACNSYTSVSLRPPLVGFCVGHTSTTWPQIRAAGRFCVNVLARHQAALAVRFARRAVDRFAGLRVAAGRGGPHIVGAVAWIDCELAAEHSAGDHDFVVGHVLATRLPVEAQRPLVFCGGRFGCFGVNERATEMALA
jgi:flavin reductase (DIM6/NTAB) family NADH-FMN oxidoreductase RutF